MKKSESFGFRQPSRSLLKTLIMMKLVILIISLTAFQVNAKLVLAQNLSFNMRNTEIKDVLKVIEKQSNYRFMYNYDSRVLNQKVDFYATNVSVTDALDKLFAGSGLTYRKVNNNLIAIITTVSETKEIIVTGTVRNNSGQAIAGAPAGDRARR